MKTLVWVIGAVFFVATREPLALWGIPAPFYFGAMAIALLLWSAGKELLTPAPERPLSLTEYDQLAADIPPAARSMSR